MSRSISERPLLNILILKSRMPTAALQLFVIELELSGDYNLRMVSDEQYE